MLVEVHNYDEWFKTLRFKHKELGIDIIRQSSNEKQSYYGPCKQSKQVRDSADLTCRVLYNRKLWDKLSDIQKKNVYTTIMYALPKLRAEGALLRIGEIHRCIPYNESY